MKLTIKQLDKLIENLLYDHPRLIKEGIIDSAAKNALLVYIENTDEGTIKGKIRKLIGPETKAGIYGEFYKNSKILIDEAFNRVEWWFKNISAHVDKSMLIKAITLFFDDREKFYDEVLAWINTHYDNLYQDYIKSFTDDKLNDIVLSRWDLYDNIDRNDYDDEEEYNDDVDLKQTIKEQDRDESEKDFMDLVINEPVVYSDEGIQDPNKIKKAAKGRLALQPKSEVLKGFESFKSKVSDDGVFSIIIAGIWDFIK
jgi:hypothetical protein